MDRYELVTTPLARSSNDKDDDDVQGLFYQTPIRGAEARRSGNKRQRALDSLTDVSLLSRIDTVAEPGSAARGFAQLAPGAVKGRCSGHLLGTAGTEVENYPKVTLEAVSTVLNARCA